MNRPPEPSNGGLLTLQQKARLYELLTRKQEIEAQKLFYRIFPDEDTIWRGPTIMDGLIEPGQTLYARESVNHVGYAKHAEFFRRGAQYRERCFMAANRCLSPWTYIQTPDGQVQSAEIVTGTGVRVQSWDGESRCVAEVAEKYLKGIEPAFRVVLDNGLFFDCSHKHRVLTTEGFASLDRLVSLSGGLRCWYSAEGFEANCVSGGYLGDRSPQSAPSIGPKLPPLSGDAQERAPLVFDKTDAAARIFRCSHIFRQLDPNPIEDDRRRLLALFSLFSGPFSARPYLPIRGDMKAVSRLARTLGDRFRSGVATCPDQSESDAHRVSGQSGFHDAACMQTVQRAKHLASAQLCDVHGPGESLREWCCDAARIPIFYPSFHPKLVGDRTILAIVPIGYQPIIDVHVPDTNTYWAGDVVHHNSGKTIAGTYELAAHLTGEYPAWWEGRRFPGPIAAWAAGDTYETTRDILQLNLLGQVAVREGRKAMDGRGIIPGHTLGQPSWRSGVADLVDTIPVRHISGKWSSLGFKSYDQGRKKFQGTGKHVILFDEEPPNDVYNEALIRTATLNGLIMLTFTPLSGLSEVVLSFLPKEQRPASFEEMTETA